MRKAEFEVPSEAMAAFAQELTDRGLDNQITGTNEDDEILVEVHYEREDSKSVDELEAALDKLKDEM